MRVDNAQAKCSWVALVSLRDCARKVQGIRQPKLIFLGVAGAVGETECFARANYAVGTQPSEGPVVLALADCTGLKSAACPKLGP